MIFQLLEWNKLREKQSLFRAKCTEVCDGDQMQAPGRIASQNSNINRITIKRQQKYNI